MLDTCGKWPGFRFNFPFLVGNFGEFEWARKKERRRGKKKKKKRGREKITHRFVSFESVGIFKFLRLAGERTNESINRNNNLMNRIVSG